MTEPTKEVEAAIADRLERVLVADMNGQRFEISRQSAVNLYRTALEVLKSHGFTLKAASRAQSTTRGEGEAWRPHLARVLADHWITSIKCDHEARADVVNCFCSIWKSNPRSSVGYAVNEWVMHVIDVLDKAGFAPSPSQRGEAETKERKENE